LLNQVNLKPCIGQVKRGAHTPNTAADDQCRGWLAPEISIQWLH
jgi:hypothetical protein